MLFGRALIPWHKYSFHPAILLWFEAAILCWDVLDQILLLLAANLGKYENLFFCCCNFLCSFQKDDGAKKKDHLLSRLELTVRWSTNLPEKAIVIIRILSN